MNVITIAMLIMAATIKKTVAAFDLSSGMVAQVIIPIKFINIPLHAVPTKKILIYFPPIVLANPIELF